MSRLKPNWLKVIVALWASLLVPAAYASTVTHIIEPDTFAEGAVLNDVHPLVELRIFNGVARTDFPVDFGIFPAPAVIPVTANENVDVFGGHFTSTGTKTFGHANIDFFPESRQLAMRFLFLATAVSIDFIGTNRHVEQTGILEVFDSTGNLLDTVTSPPLRAHEISTLTMFRPSGDIRYARAFSSSAGNPFGTLDNLRFNVVPEPTALLLAIIAGALLARVRFARIR